MTVFKKKQLYDQNIFKNDQGEGESVLEEVQGLLLKSGYVCPTAKQAEASPECLARKRCVEKGGRDCNFQKESAV